MDTNNIRRLRFSPVPNETQQDSLPAESGRGRVVQVGGQQQQGEAPHVPGQGEGQDLHLPQSQPTPEETTPPPVRRSGRTRVPNQLFPPSHYQL